MANLECPGQQLALTCFASGPVRLARYKRGAQTRSNSATAKAKSIDWRPLSRGSHMVS